MNGQDPDVEPPGWNELGYGLYQWTIFFVLIALGGLLFDLSIILSLELHQFLFKYRLQ